MDLEIPSHCRLSSSQKQKVEWGVGGGVWKGMEKMGKKKQKILFYFFEINKRL